MRIVAFSGLGSNARDFKYLNHELIHIIPVKRVLPTDKEDVRNYIRRLIQLLKLEESHFDAIMGFSFGGILAQALAAEWPTKPLILIASFTSKQEIYPLSRRKFWGTFAQIAPKSSVPAVLGIGKFVFGSRSSKTVRYILETTSEQYLRWAIYTLAQFDGFQAIRFSNTHRIMAKNDPFIMHHACGTGIQRLTSGGHFILKTRSTEVSNFILDIKKSL